MMLVKNIYLVEGHFLLNYLFISKFDNPRTAYQYSFVGPLSLSKGCDFAFPIRRTLRKKSDAVPIPDFAYRGPFLFVNDYFVI